jgi:hypothetical protein
VFDASAKYPYGIIDGLTVHLGSFDQCYRINAKLSGRRGRHGETEMEEVRGRYCLVDFKYEQRGAPVDFNGKLDLEFDPSDSVWESIRVRDFHVLFGN